MGCGSVSVCVCAGCFRAPSSRLSQPLASQVIRCRSLVGPGWRPGSDRAMFSATRRHERLGEQEQDGASECRPIVAWAARERRPCFAASRQRRHIGALQLRPAVTGGGPCSYPEASVKLGPGLGPVAAGRFMPRKQAFENLAALAKSGNPIATPRRSHRICVHTADPC